MTTIRSGICPKCGHATVYSGRDVPAKGSIGNTIPINFKNSVALDNYVCITCGYVESYISDPAALQRIEAEWPDAHAKKRKRR